MSHQGTGKWNKVPAVGSWRWREERLSVAGRAVPVRHMIDRLGDPGALRVCYGRGTCGFQLHRLLASMRPPVT